MTSEFGTWRNPLECERLAKAYWNDGALFPPKPLHRPRIGQPWPADFIPYWRTYIDRPIPPHRPYFYAWGSIRDTEFWRKLSIRLTNDTILSRGISWAGMVGNVEAFQAMTSTVLNDYSKAILESPGHVPAPSGSFSRTLIQTARHRMRLVHPDVIDFMRTREIWTDTDALNLAHAYNTNDLRSTIRHVGLPEAISFSDFEPGFLEHWFDRALKTPGWGASEQVMFLLHWYQHVDPSWTHQRLQRARRDVHPDVDTVLLAMCVGFEPVGIDHEPTQVETNRKPLYNTVHQWQIASHGLAAMDVNAEKETHQGLMALLQAMDPKTPWEVYNIAAQCLRSEMQGPAVSEWKLPSLA